MPKHTNPWGRKPPQGQRPGGTGPSGRGKGGGTPPNKPDLDAWLRQGQDAMRGMLGSGSGNEKRMALMLLGALVVLWLGSGIYRVNSDELGIVTRFGEYNRTTNPGLNYHLPYPVETVVVPSVTRENTIEIGYRGRGVNAAPNQLQTREGQMLTADRNIVDIDFAVQWKIDAIAPQDFVFNMRDPEVTIRAVAESAMREVIGRHNLDDILIAAQTDLPPVSSPQEQEEVPAAPQVRVEIAEDAKRVMQDIFDEYKAGVIINGVNVTRRDVPQPVIDEFQDIASAKQNKVTLESRALGKRNQIIPEAKGEAAKMEQDALAYKAKVIADAQGDVARFNSIYEEYVQAKDVTKRRLYLETMEAVMKDMPKMIIDPSARGNGGTVQMLPVPTVRPAAVSTGGQP